MRYGSACGKCASQLVEGRLGHLAAGVGEVAHRAARLQRPRLVGDLDPQRRHAGQTGDPVPGAQAYHVARQQVVHQHDMRADAEGGGQLAEAGVETQRKYGKDHVVGGVVQILADTLGADDQVAVAQHHALGLAGAARGVEDRRHVEIDTTLRFGGGVLGNRTARATVDRAPRTRRRVRIDAPASTSKICVTLGTHSGRLRAGPAVPVR